MAEFEPKIVAFLCNWCSYRGADLAGTSRIKYPTNVRAIRVMRSGSIDPVYILKALLDGADGVKKALNYVSGRRLKEAIPIATCREQEN